MLAILYLLDIVNKIQLLVNGYDTNDDSVIIIIIILVRK